MLFKWSTCSPYPPTIRVRIPLKTSVYSVKFVLEKNENKQKEVMFGPFEKHYTACIIRCYVLPRYKSRNGNMQS